MLMQKPRLLHSAVGGQLPELACTECRPLLYETDYSDLCWLLNCESISGKRERIPVSLLVTDLSAYAAYCVKHHNHLPQKAYHQESRTRTRRLSQPSSRCSRQSA